jgi:hypothetical protein
MIYYRELCNRRQKLMFPSRATFSFNWRGETQRNSCGIISIFE